MKIGSACVIGALAGVLACALGAASALAAPPQVSGKYAMMAWGNCQAKFTTKSRDYKLTDSKSGPAVWELSPGGLGEFSVETGYVTFTPSSMGSTSGTFSGSSTAAHGSVLAINSNGTPVTEKTEQFSGNYSATNTTFTIGGDVFVLSFGNVAGGIAGTVNVVRKEDARCVAAMTFTRSP